MEWIGLETKEYVDLVFERLKVVELSKDRGKDWVKNCLIWQSHEFSTKG